MFLLACLLQQHSIVLPIKPILHPIFHIGSPSFVIVPDKPHDPHGVVCIEKKIQDAAKPA